MMRVKKPKTPSDFEWLAGCWFFSREEINTLSHAFRDGAPHFSTHARNLLREPQHVPLDGDPPGVVRQRRLSGRSRTRAQRETRLDRARGAEAVCRNSPVFFGTGRGRARVERGRARLERARAANDDRRDVVTSFSNSLKSRHERATPPHLSPPLPTPSRHPRRLRRSRATPQPPTAARHSNALFLRLNA